MIPKSESEQDKPSVQMLRDALAKAGQAHHDFENLFLRGVRDEQWAGWYAAHVHGQLGDFMPPSKLAQILEETHAKGDWISDAARNVFDALG